MLTRLLPTPVTIPEKFVFLICALIERVGDRLREGPQPYLDSALIMRIQERLTRMRRRIARLLARIEAGTLRPPRPFHRRERPPRPETAGAGDDPGTPRNGPTLPTGNAWLCGLVPQWAAWVGYQLAQLLATPEVAALVAENPRLADELRPLCRMVAVDPKLLPPRQPRPATISKPAPPPPPDPPPPVRQWEGGGSTGGQVAPELPAKRFRRRWKNDPPPRRIPGPRKIGK